jgi:hypothetical protein
MPRAQANIALELKLPDPRTIAFAPNTHELLMRLFSARKPGPIEVLTTDGEFHSFRRQAQRWEEARLVTRRVVPCEPFETFTERFLAAMREKQPDVAFLSHVMFKSGLRFDGAEELASYATPGETWVALDLYHSFMAMPSDFSRWRIASFFWAAATSTRWPAKARASFTRRRLCAAPELHRLVRRFWRDGSQARRSRLRRRWLTLFGRDVRRDGLYRFNAVQEMLFDQALDTPAISCARRDFAHDDG